MSGETEPQIVYFRMCDEDRERYGGPEWGELDIDRLMDSRAGWLERIERQSGGFPVERMLGELQLAWPGARAVRMALWLGRKQTGDATVWTEDGKPESWDAFDPKVLRVRMQSTPPEEESETDPLPEGAPPGEPVGAADTETAASPATT